MIQPRALDKQQVKPKYNRWKEINKIGADNEMEMKNLQRFNKMKNLFLMTGYHIGEYGFLWVHA